MQLPARPSISLSLLAVLLLGNPAVNADYFSVADYVVNTSTDTTDSHRIHTLVPTTTTTTTITTAAPLLALHDRGHFFPTNVQDSTNTLVFTLARRHRSCVLTSTTTNFTAAVYQYQTPVYPVDLPLTLLNDHFRDPIMVRTHSEDAATLYTANPTAGFKWYMMPGTQYKYLFADVDTSFGTPLAKYGFVEGAWRLSVLGGWVGTFAHPKDEMAIVAGIISS